VPPREDTAAVIRENYAKLEANRVPFVTFNAKVDVDYQGGDGKKEDVNITLRMFKDSLIWLSAGKLGFEGLRVLITPDSVELLDKMDKVYTRRSVAYLQEVTGLPLDLPALQDLIIGNPVFLDSNIVSFDRSREGISLLSIGEWFKNLVTLNDGVMHHSKLDDVDISRNRTCYLSYDDYETKRGPNFATRRRIRVSEKSNLDIKLEFRSYSFNETLSFPFPIPKNYKRN
jgi:hypothetical protein